MENIRRALEAFQQQKPIILIDAEDRENEGDLIFPAELINKNIMNFMIRNGSGIVCLPLAAEYIERLALPQMVQNNTSQYGTAFTVSIEAKTGVSTGVSAEDRVQTILTAIADQTKPEDLARPGHVFPLRADPAGVLNRPGHTEACIDLMKIGNYKLAAVLCEVMNPDGTMAKGQELVEFALEHDLPILTIETLIEYRRHANTA